MHAGMQLSERMVRCCTRRLRHADSCAQPRGDMLFLSLVFIVDDGFIAITHQLAHIAAHAALIHTFSRHG